MNANKEWTIAVVGGGGRITGATILELLVRSKIRGGRVRLYSRSRDAVELNLQLADRVCSKDNRLFELTTAESLDEVLQGADIVLYGATAGLEAYEPFQAFGVSQGAHILHVGEAMARLCPDAWFLVLTNPPDISLSAVYRRFKLEKVIGLCNAARFNRKVLAAYLNCEEEELQLDEIGVNHELWFYDIRLQGQSIYQKLRQTLPLDYDLSKVNSAFLDRYPEWKLGFVNNIEILKATGYLSSQVGFMKRFADLPITSQEIGKLMKRPSKSDFLDCLQPDKTTEDILNVTRRCAAEFPIYIAEIIESIILDLRLEHSVQTLNMGMLPAYPQHVMLHITGKVGRNGIERPIIGELPAYIEGVLASRIRQNAMLSEALASQDEDLVRQSILVLPERSTIQQAREIASNRQSVEPYIPLN
ncbi:MAG: alpha-glucosidase/alpha-galactosidase [Paenibacillus sp.]|nr:alpha-glucosidase/alpha-galactosidase [Paenibacillus sp.]